MSTSIGRKIAMALSALFLIVFLLQHMSINMLSVIDGEIFNEVSHFMGTNPLVQFVLQPVLIFGVIFHFVMGFVLELKNNAARNSKYAVYKGAANSTWMSRNMIISGVVILLFMALHFYDFWIHEISVKYGSGDMTGLINPDDPESGLRYYEELRHKFVDVWRVAIYVLAFVFLGLHLQHGFQSAFQSVGVKSSIGLETLNKVGNAYAVLVPLGFIFIAIFHFITQ